MTDAFNLDNYKCTSLPPKLWRVIHPKSRSEKDLETGDLIASNRTLMFSNESSLKEALDEHWKWASPIPSCFLSVFSDYGHALKWAGQRASNSDRTDVFIHEIDTTQLSADSYVFDAAHLVARFGLSYKHSTDEFLFLHRIPKGCLTGWQSLQHIETELEILEIEAMHRRNYAAGRRARLRYHALHNSNEETEDSLYYNTDDEYEEACWADEMMDEYEGRWDN